MTSQPTSSALSDRAARSRPPQALATPGLYEAQRTHLGSELEQALAPLVAYCENLADDETLGLSEFRRAQQLRQAIEVLLRYDAQTEQLLDYYRRALALAQHQAARRIPTLEEALRQPASTIYHVEP